MSDRFLIYHHLGLGDHITLSPLVRLGASKREEIHLIVRPQYLENVKFLYSDVPNIKYITCSEHGDWHSDNIFNEWVESKLKHFYQSEWIDEDKGKFFEDGWYTSVGLESNFRKDNFILKRNIEREKKAYNDIVTNNRFAFVHDDPSRGYNIDIDFDGQIIRAHEYPDYLVFDFLKIMDEAASIHVMYSSFFALLEITDTPCFLHETDTNKVNGIHENRIKEFASRGIIVM